MNLHESLGNPYQEGRDACDNGELLESSNYVPFSEGEEEWVQGWQDRFMETFNESTDIDEDVIYESDDKFFLEQGWIPDAIMEAKYKGQDVELNKPTRGDVKRFKVYVNSGKKDGDGNIIAQKVNFGSEKGSSLRVKKNDPEARKQFAARHKCDTATDPTTARYWSCRGATSTSDAKYW